jgi:hypothetical protein
VYFLDGKPSSAKEALAVGRTICHTANDMAIFVSSRPGPATKAGKGSVRDGLARIEMRGALRFTAAKMTRSGAGEMEPIATPVTLVLDLGKDGIAGTAVVGLFGFLSDHVLDCSGLSRRGDRIVGPVALRIELPEAVAGDKEKQGYRLEHGNTIEASWTLDAAVADDATVSGRFEGTSNGAAVEGDLGGEVLGRSPMPAKPRVWLQLSHVPFLRKGYLVLTLSEGRARPGGAILFSKGHRLGTITAADLRLEGDRLKGTLTGTISEHEDAPVAFTIDARLLGNRLLSGPCTMAAGDETARCTVRGGLCEADTCRIEGPTPEQEAQVKAMQAALGK